ncbi:hypothetical protein BHF71_08340 [Vulcanibacillus modesticaldus]|uniref:SHOCT domain-containing protein n=1 Tax=Vulcanibacillus modesticaldus TaxID=337097 RepID=A0A1D2YV75_9BACI|nr:SHOCT domain-containing protein [Vulcanibacillus modesticaldus]OEF99622.1 hypothetical protein BHF71_08340 [Vulcanibacillus modesticaldus]
MVNIILTLIVAYYLIRTGDLFKLIRKIRRFIVDFIVSLKQETNEIQTADDPLDILKLRFAKGEISAEEFEKMKTSL